MLIFTILTSLKLYNTYYLKIEIEIRIIEKKIPLNDPVVAPSDSVLHRHPQVSHKPCRSSPETMGKQE